MCVRVPAVCLGAQGPCPVSAFPYGAGHPLCPLSGAPGPCLLTPGLVSAWLPSFSCMAPRSLLTSPAWLPSMRTLPRASSRTGGLLLARGLWGKQAPSVQVLGLRPSLARAVGEHRGPSCPGPSAQVRGHHEPRPAGPSASPKTIPGYQEGPGCYPGTPTQPGLAPSVDTSPCWPPDAWAQLPLRMRCCTSP